MPTIWAMPDSYNVVHDHVLNAASVVGNDMLFMNAGPLAASLVSGPSHGNLTLNSDGTFQFTPASGYAGSDSFVYQASANGESSNATVTINVTNMAPIAMGQSLSIGHDQVLTNINLLTNASDSDGDTLQAIIVTNPAHGSVYVNPNGTWNYYAATNWTGTDSFTFNATDGLANSSAATITISVTNTAPSASNASFAIGHDQFLPGIDLQAYLSDYEYDPLQVSIVSGPSHGQLTQNDDGTYIYTPASQYVGADTFTFKANDGVADSYNGTITIDVTQYAPTSNNTYSWLHDRTLANINFALNDADAMGNPSWIAIGTAPSHGALTQNSDGTYNYAPNAHFYGSDTVVIRAAIPNVYGPWQDVTVTINVTDNAPVAGKTDLSFEAYNHVYAGVAFLANAVDRDNDTLTWEIVTSPQHGSLALNSSTTLYDYHAATSYLGRDSFSIRYYDGAQYSDLVTYDILVCDDTTNYGTDSYVQGYKALGGAAFNGDPNGLTISQGQIGDCWFISAGVGLAQARPAELARVNGAGLITSNPDGTFTVNFPGRNAVTITFLRGPYVDPAPAPLAGDDFSFSTSAPDNGDWMAILEQAWAKLNLPDVSMAWAIRGSLHLPNPGFAGIRFLTNHGVDPDLFANTRRDVTAGKLNAALNGNDKRIVTALSLRGGFGLVPIHVYSVIGYNDGTETVTVRNPHGRNRETYSDRALQVGLSTRWLPGGDAGMAVSGFLPGPNIRGGAPGDAIGNAVL